MKKRIALILAGVSSCLLLLTGCSETKQYADDAKKEAYFTETDEMMQDLFTLSDADCNEKVDYYTEFEDDTMVSMYQAWANENSSLGDYVGVGEYFVYESDDSGTYAKSYAVEIKYDFSKTDLDVKVIYGVEENGETTSEITSISLSGDYTTAQKMGKAGLNTLMGMGTVFVVLILITCIISLFGKVGEAMNKAAKKKAEKKAPKAEAPAAAPAAPAAVVEEEDLTDDLELVAVISAAVAAYEEANGGSSDGLVVRSIRRKNNKWRNA